MDSKVIFLLKSARLSGIDINVNKGELQLKVSKTKGIDPQLLQGIKDHKEDIIDFLNNPKWKSVSLAETEKSLKPYDRNNIKKVSLSFGQERLWFIDQMEGSLQYHIPTVLRLKGKLNIQGLSYALQTLVNRHESLRSVIYEEQGESYQQVMTSGKWELLITEGVQYENNPEGLQQYIQQLIAQPFDLTKDYMLRATLIRLEKEEHVLVVTMHHIASDGWSVPIIVKEVSELYKSYVEDRPLKLMPLPIQYADFTMWQREYLQGAVLENKMKYWKEKLQDIPTLQLPTDFTRPTVQSSRGRLTAFSIEKELLDQVQHLGHQRGATLFMTLLAAFNALLHRYSGQQDICVGTPIAGRQHEELEGLIGFFVNTLALRTFVNEEDSFAGLLAEVKNTTIEAYEHQDVPFEKVVEVVVKERDLSRSPLFQVMFVLQNTPDIPELIWPELSLSAETLENNTTKFDITFSLTETAGVINGTVEYATDLYSESTIRAMIEHYKNLLTAIVKSPHQKIGLLPMLSRAEQHELLVSFNDTAVAYPREKSISELFEEQVLRTPGNIAVGFEEEAITYQQLNERSNRLAHYLRSRGVKENTLVPICIERSINMVVGVIGILKAGAAYVPLDPDYPLERILYMISDVQANLILTSRQSSPLIPAAENLTILEIDSHWSAIEKQPLTNPVSFYEPHHLTYLLYTSGSTGRPKGVQMHGGALVNLINWQEKQFANKHRRALQFSSLNFDASFHDMFSMLCYGSTLYLISAERRTDPAELVKDIVKYKITHLFIPYIVLKNIAENIASLSPAGFQLEEIIVAGEQLKITDDILLLLKNKSIGSIINEYGPTEAHVVSSYRIDSSGEVPLLPPIGKPIDNTRLYIVGKSNELVPIGVTGELYIGGVQVAQGYLNQPEQTREKFISDIFSNDPGARLYKTGDMARWMADGNIEYLGRIDDQVKIRGFRIELGEIESVLQECSLVRQAVVLAREDHQGNKRLIGYIVPEGIYDKEGIIAYLQQKVPAYMVPGLWVELAELPVTSNGKVNRKALPDADMGALTTHAYVAPRDLLELKLAGIWQNLLGVERVGIEDNFFELGGHSLLATRVVSSIRSQLQVEVAIKDLFIYPRISALGQHLRLQSKGLLLPPIEVAEAGRGEHIPLSFSQERLWFIDQLKGSVPYHLPSILRLKGTLDKDALVKSLQLIVQRHEILRTVIVEEQGRSSQYIKEIDGWRLHFINGDVYKDDREGLRQYISELIKAPFDLSKDYMLRCHLLELNREDHLLVATMHHIASDGWSMSIIVKELVEAYAAFIEDRPVALPTLPVQYADYAIWQRTYLQGEILDKKLSYWKEKLQGVSTLELPTDYARPAVQSTRGAIARFDIDKDLTEQLNGLCHKQGTTLFMTLLAAFNVVLHRYSGQDDICIGTPIAGRNQMEVESLIGLFINTLALRSDLSNNPSFETLLQQVKITTLEAYANQEVPFEKVVEVVGNPRDMSRNPLFQVLLTMQNTPEIPEFRLGALKLSVEEYEHTTSQLDIICNIVETVEGLKLSVVYCTDLFNNETVVGMMAHFKQLLISIVAAPQQSIGSLPMLGDEEQHRLLLEFNNTKADYGEPQTIVTLFEEQVIKTPLNVAVAFEGEQMTYEQLNDSANQLANYLRVQGIKAEQLIPVCIDRSLEMLVVILGILKAGAVYVPIDPQYPEERINYLLKDTAASIVISNGLHSEKLSNARSVSMVLIDEDRDVISRQKRENLQLNIGADQLAYVIYTSGSTGRPKGVMIEHRNLYNYLLNNKTNYLSEGVSGSGSFVHLSYTFDASLTALLMPLLSGKLVVISSGGPAEVFEDANLQKYAPYDFIKITPSHLSLLQPKMRVANGVLLTQRLVIGGEALLQGHLNSLIKEDLDITIINEYGPTEATVGCSVFSFNLLKDKDQISNSISIGKPIDNVAIYILNDSNELLPVGIKGELCIGGAGVARGYLNLADLTAEKFIQDPFSKEPGARMYKTGDLGKWSPDGNLIYLGRRDEQVKIRGYRIELGEIESVLHECRSIGQAVVLAKENKDGLKNLVAYVVIEDGYTYDREDIFSCLKAKLPEYMIPAKMMKLEEMPLTINGKIDRNSLPDPDVTAQANDRYIAPRNKMEEVLVGIWQDVLELDQVGVENDFFDLGGHSLLAIQLISLIRKEFQVEMQISDIFNYPTIALLADRLLQPSGSAVLPSIAAVPIRPDHIPLSFGQERLWFIDKLEGSTQYHVPAVLRLKGTLNTDALSYSLQQIINRHEVLRTIIYEEDGQGYQHINNKNSWQLNSIDGEGYNGDEEIIKKNIAQLINKPFDLSKDHMLRADLIQLKAAEHILVLTIHHIASDGWSTGIMVDEMVELWKAYEENKQASLSELPFQFADFAIWQRSYLQGTILENKLTFWKEKLNGVEPLQLPTDYQRPLIQSTKGAVISFSINNEITEGLQQLSRQEGATLFMTLLAAYKLLLFRYSGQQDICVGTPISGRQQTELEGLIGFFLNTLVIRTEVTHTFSFTELLQEIRTNTLDAYEHQDVPFEKVVEAVVKERNLSRSPLFQVMFIMQNIKQAKDIRLGEIALSGELNEHNTTKFDITFSLTETAGVINGTVEYATDLYSESTIRAMIEHYKNLLTAIVKSPHQKIGLLPMLSRAEQHELLVSFNDTAVAYPREKSISELFEEQVLRTPGNIAVGFEEEAITYQQLNERSNRLAHYLRSRGVKENTLVPICIERSINMVVGVIGILKAGAAYVPLDPDYPLERILYMISDVQANLILTSRQSSPLIPAAENLTILEIDSHWSAIEKQPLTNPVSFYEPHHLTYLLYTSGSTGRPKGVQMHGGALVNLINWQEKQFANKHRRALQFSSLNFDASFHDMFSMLCYGSRLYLISAERRTDPAELVKDIVKYKITHLFIPYIVLKNIAENIASLSPAGFQLEEIIVAGEQLKITDDILLLLKNKSIGSIINEYGPTEAHVVSSYRIDSSGEVPLLPPIGKPIDNTRLYIVGKSNELVPIGVTGELYIGGVQVAQGYLNQPEQTREKFISDIFSNDPGARLYKTGDMARWMADGNIEYLGRIDDQVKIRGFRIELGEIESVLQECSLVRQAVVLAREDHQGNKRLIGYIVPEGIYDKEGIIAYLQQKVPAYMVPGLWVELAELPVTSNGKVNRKALPDADMGALTTHAYVAPRDLLELKLAGIWQNLLGVERVGIEDNFFELGGHSLLATRVVSSIRSQLQVEVAIKDLFIYPRISALGQHLRLQSKGLLLPPIEVAEAGRGEHIPLSFSQERLWFIDQLEGSLQYHVPAVLRLKGKVDITALSDSLKMVVNRHETLRTIFRQENGRAYQYIREPDEWGMSVIESSVFDTGTQSLHSYINELVRNPFDLSKDYMLRASLIRLSSEDHILVATMHHIASDGWSISIIVTELVEAYAAFAENRPATLLPLPIQYADYAIWQRNYLQGPVFDKKLGYWKSKLEGVAILQLPTDFSRPPVWSTRGAVESFHIDKDLLNKLHELSKQRSSTLFMTLLSAFKVLMYRYSGQEDICVGTPIAGRQQEELEGLIGFFVNTLALRTEVKGAETFTDLLQKVRVVTMEAYENQEVPFEKVVDEVVKERDISRNPLFQVMVVMLNIPEIPALNLSELSLSSENSEHTTAKFDLQVFFTEKPDGLTMLAEYSTDLFTATTINRMMEHFKELLSSIVKNPHQTISSFSMLTIAEEHRLLVELNSTQVDYPKDKNVIDLFEEQVSKTPDAIAVVFEEEQLTYDELNQLSNQLSNYLKGIGVKEETLVPICFERSLQMIVAIWGVLKAGAAYVPIDPEYPEDRVRYMLEDTKASIIITNQESKNRFSYIENIQIVELNDDFHLIKNEPVINAGFTLAPNKLAYVIYTSGSTGKPKGVMNEHGGLANRLFWAQNYFKLNPDDVVLQKTTFSFDVSVWELLWPSLIGARLVFAKPGGQKDNAYLKFIIEENKVSIIHFVPSMLEVFLPNLQDDDCPSLRKVLCSGEALKPAQVELFKEKLPHAELHNLYGPTEAAIDVTCWTLADREQNINIVPIGKPVANTSIYILDENRGLVPQGGLGEIYIGGIQVARGYLNRPELTAASFVINPFDAKSNSRLYKTGDLGRWMQDGNIEYLGRKDEQVKIRGYRIELGEIEAVLQQDELVDQAVVIAKAPKQANLKLISYYTPDWEAVKEKERHLYMDRVENWKELYDTEYAKTEEIIDEEFNLIGWNSSFTGDAIPASEMRQWVEDIVSVILSEQTENVLEIGCGTGLIYYPLAGKVKKYIGTDLSQISNRQINERIRKNERDYGPTELMTCAAHEVVLPADEQVDTVILNSIVQYFPGEDYLNTVIEKNIALLKGKGRMIIGDIRDIRLLELFKGRLQSDILQDSVSIQEFKWAVEQEVLRENELCIDPGYFFRLQNLYPEIAHIAIQWKQGDYINELTSYRYTVVIYLGDKREVIEPNWQRWQDLAGNTIITDQLEKGMDTIAIKDAPNPRLWKDKALSIALNYKSATTLGDLLLENVEQDTYTAQINEILKIALDKGYNYRLLLDEDPLKVNIILEAGTTNKFFNQAYSIQKNRSVNNLTNVPLFIDISRQMQKDIRSTLQKKLPDYMVPVEIIAIRKIPLTGNGKVDRKFLSLQEEKSMLNAGDIIPPSTIMEHQLVTIWKELLGIEQIGIEENFFELGGDSILTIQVVSRLKRLGYELQPKDVFIHQTIGKLSAAIAERSGSAVVSEQGVLTGLSGLLPIQQWHLQDEQPDNSYFNQAVLLGLDKAISASGLTLAIEQLVEHHDALRFKYYLLNDQWQQEYIANTGKVYIEDLQSVPDDLLNSTITKKAAAHQRSLNIESGELIRVVWMQTPSVESKNRLLIIVHHLAIDGVSWRILLEDLELLLTKLMQGEKVSIGHKSSSYRQWYQALAYYGQRRRLIDQLNYWQKAVNSYQPLPVDKVSFDPIVAKDIVNYTFRLNARHTGLLLQEVPRVYHTEINDILLAALADSLCDWSGSDKITIGLEGHGREDIDTAVDITRTVGWFTSLYPLLLVLPESRNEADVIQSVKEQLRQVPDKGLGYGVLKYINKETSLQAAGDPWDIMFNYLGQLDNIVTQSKWLSGAGESSGPVMGDEHVVKEKILVNCSVSSGELVLGLRYSSRHYHEKTIEDLSASYLSNLKKLIDHCIEQKSVGLIYTPSDYGLSAEIAYDELNLFLAEPVDGKERRTSIEGLYRLSGLQEGMLFHGLYDTGIGAYIEQFACDLVGVEMETFKESWAQLIKRHSVLRSAFYVDAFRIPVQCVYKNVVIPLVVKDLRGMNDEEQATAIKTFDEADWDKGFDFKAAPLMRLGLLRLSEDKYRMLWTSHHILFDGWSFPILMEEFLSTYELLSSDNEIVSVPEDRYEDYIRYIERSDKEKEEEYWRNYLKGIEQNTLLPFVGTTIDRNKGVGAYQAVEINLYGATAKRLHSFAQRNRLTLNTIMQGVWAYLLHHYTGNKNIVFGIVVSGRPDDLSGVEHRVGMYINTLPLHSSIKEEDGIIEWLKTIQAEQVNSRQYQHTPFSIVQEWSGVQGDLFDTLLTFENYPFDKVFTKKQWTLNVTNVQVKDQTNYPLSIVISSAEHINIRFSYNATLLDEAYVKEIRDHFENVLLQIVDKGNSRLQDITLLTSAEQHRILKEFNHPDTRQIPDKTVIDLFAEQVLKTPDALAVVYKESTCTYRELHERSNRYAHYFRSKGVKQETLVPVCLDASMEMLTAVLGILKAGGAYVPIDPDAPRERIIYMLEDIGASIVITSKESRMQLPETSEIDIIEIDNDDAIVSRNPVADVKQIIIGDQLAYIIYTSGTTGKPKGVMIEHKSLVNYLLNNKTNYNSAAENTTGSYVHLSYTFDASLTAMFMPFLDGKAIVISSKQSVDIFEDSNLLKYAPYDFIKITPSHLDLIQPQFKAYSHGILTEKLVIGGEALYPGQFDAFIRDGINVEVINEYGPTEATVGCTTYSFYTLDIKEKLETGISIGKPIDHAAIYILGSNNELVPVGINGEICIGGAGLARGYLNLPDVTSEKFINNPFSDKPGHRIYKTGDIGRWLPDGNIEYIGRTDDQVKIRGYRIELGEVEHVLQQTEWVSQAVVLAKEDTEGVKRLSSYYIPNPEVLKAKERELNEQRVASWKELYETEYGQTEDDENIDPEFNIIGWNDSFTGQPIPAPQMKEWLDDIVDVVLSAQPENVLEIGCGTGLIYYQLAGKVKKYIGSDLSKSSINQIRQRISKKLRNYGETELFTAPAHEVTLQAGQQVDTILLNSIVQYFPGEDYMNAVMDNCMHLLQGRGRIIIGDVRDNRLLPLFRGRLRIQKSQDSVPVREFKWGLEQDVIKEEELCFSPAYFYGLEEKYPQIKHVEIQWKKADYINELSLYRYTVVIYVGMEKEVIVPQWQCWDEVADKETVFSDNGDDKNVVALRNVPNPRLWKEGMLQDALQHTSFRTVGDIQHGLEKESQDTIQLKQLLQVATSKGYSQKLFVNENPLKLDLLFEKQPSQGLIRQSLAQKESYRDEEKTNIPLFTDISFLLQKDIRKGLQSKLPEYMVPSEFIALQHLPLTTNGKTDRLFLSRHEERVFVNTLNYLPPLTVLEKALAEIWKELLHLERVGIEDNFFDIGGHSLLAMRLISAIRKQLEIELTIKDLFVYPAIGLLAGHIQKRSKGLLLPVIKVIDPRPLHIPLSFSQERLWFIDQLSGSVQYHIPAVLRLKGTLSVKALSYSLQQIIRRHEILRTVISNQEGSGYQTVMSWEDWELEITDGWEFQKDVSGLQEYIRGTIEKPFNLSKDYMLRATLVVTGAGDYVLAATLHHISSDGWSASILVSELAELYNAYVEGRQARLPVLPVQYTDYAIWQRTYLQGKEWENKLGYWKEKLQGVAALQMPLDYPRPLVQSSNGANTAFRLSKEISDKLQLLSQQQGVTLFMTVLAAFKVLLYRYSGQQDICVGTPIAGRQQSELEGLIGFFVNTLALRTEVNGNATFIELLQKVRTTTLEAYDYQEVPFEKVVELVVRDRDMSRSPLFQVMFVQQNTPETGDLQLSGLQLSHIGEGMSGHVTSKFDLTFTIGEHKDGLGVLIEYCTDLYNAQTINALSGHFRNLLQSIVNAPGQSLGTLPMLGEKETEHLLNGLNNTERVFLTERKTVVGLFEEQAFKRPEATALIYRTEHITYSELNEHSNRLAHYLINKGVKAETLVPVCMNRGPGLVTAMLGILKAGGAYVPIDPEYPDERISYMVKDTGAFLMLTDGKRESQLPVLSMDDEDKNVEIIELPALQTILATAPSFIQAAEVSESQLAYVIYTSGSTGRPKGVMIEHGSLSNLIGWHNQEYEVSKKSRATAMAGVGFDAFGWEVWPYLSCGASVLMLDDSVRLNTARLVQQLIEAEVTHSFIATALAADFVNASAHRKTSLQYVLTGGDKLSYIENRALSYTLVNNYGPTENTVVTTSYKLSNDDIYLIPPIGKPISNTVVYIVSEDGELVPEGVVGELWIGGRSLARGYLHQVALTAEKFVPDSFKKTAGARLYKSGDLCRWLKGGNLEYTGRKDEQIKIRGYRIEPGEIESIARQSGLVKECIIIARADKEGGRHLIGYVVGQEQAGYSKEVLMSYLSERLPAYMVPQLWQDLEQLPLTANGKVDKKALQEMQGGEGLSATAYVAPRTEVEEQLALIWQELLGVERVGVYDNFFELGGHSLLAMRLVSYIEKSLSVSIPIKALFQFTSINDLSKYLAMQTVAVQDEDLKVYKTFDI